MNIFEISPMFWYIAGKFSALLFITVAGISFFLSSNSKEWRTIFKKYLKRSFILGIIASLISFITFIFIPDEFIIFGILHFFALSFLLLPFFTPLQKWNILGGVIFIILGNIFKYLEVNNPYLFAFGLTKKGFQSGDYYPLFPWFGVLLIGYSIFFFFSREKRDILLGGYLFKNNFLSFMGKNSLLIYIIHPIIIYTVFALLLRL